MTKFSEFLNRDDEFWGIDYDKDGESKFQDNDFSGVQCTGYAIEIAKRIPETKVMGFAEWDNPGTIFSDPGSFSDGHDFAVVAGRWIVDPWLVEFGNARQLQAKDAKGVYDLQDPEDAEEIKKIYGDLSKWKELGSDG